MFKLKTNTEVVINSKTLQTAFVFMDVKDVVFNGQWYTGSIEYYWEKEVPTGELDVDTQSPIVNIIKVNLEESFVTFQVAEADAIEQSVGTLTGETFTEKFVSLVQAGIMYQLMLTPVFGLNATGWTIQAQPQI